MRFALLSEQGDAWWLARRLAREGHTVGVWIRDPSRRHAGDGLVDKLVGPTVVDGTDCVLVDGATPPGAFRSRGIAVLGGRPALDLATAGIRQPRTEPFKTVAQARAFLATHPGAWDWPGERSGPALTVARHLQWAAPAGAFTLRQGLAGSPVSILGWCDGTRWVGPWVELRGTATVTAAPLPGVLPPRATALVTKLLPQLRAAAYAGPVRVDGIVDARGVPHALAVSTSLNLPAWALLVQGNLGQQLAQCARGRLDRFDVRPDACATVVRVTTATPAQGLPLAPAFLDAPDTTLLGAVMVGRDGLPECAGPDETVAWVGAIGDDATWTAEDRAAALDVPGRAPVDRPWDEPPHTARDASGEDPSADVANAPHSEVLA